MTELHTEKKTRLHLVIRDRILNMLIKSGCRRGDPLPSYRDMTDRFHVSLVTIQRAMDELIKDGIVRGWPGRGTFLDREVTQSGRRLTQVGLVINCARKTFFSSTYLMEIFQGVMLQCEELNVDTRLFSIKNEGTLTPRQIAESGVDGVLLLAVNHDAYIQELVQEFSPVVVLDHSTEKVATDFLVCDTQPAMDGIVAHLVKLGHRRMAFVANWTTDTIAGLQGLNPDIESPISIERRNAFMQAMCAAGLSDSASVYELPAAPLQTLTHVVDGWTKQAVRPTAIILNSAGDVGILDAEFAARGVRVPHDISLAAVAGTGSEGISGGKVVTYQRVHFIEMGRQAVSILSERCAELRPMSSKLWRIGADFIEGGTTGACRVPRDTGDM